MIQVENLIEFIVNHYKQFKLFRKLINTKADFTVLKIPRYIVTEYQI